VALTPRGRRLTEEHRREQLRVRATFLTEFLALFDLLDWFRLDLTTEAWLRAVMAIVRSFREESATTAEQYYREFRLIEEPEDKTFKPAPVIEITRRPRTGARGRALPDREPKLVTPRFGELVKPRIDWGDNDEAAERSLRITGPGELKRQAAAGRNERDARRTAMVTASGSAGRHVLAGGRRVIGTLINADDEALGWMRVTDGNPCAFCAMLSGRGPVYKTRQAAEFQPHDNCACQPEPVFGAASEWPGRGREFGQLWADHIAGNYSGKAALNAWRRLYERPEIFRRKNGIEEPAEIEVA
jgi:Vilmaviridae head maturation protease